MIVDIVFNVKDLFAIKEEKDEKLNPKANDKSDGDVSNEANEKIDIKLYLKANIETNYGIIIKIKEFIKKLVEFGKNHRLIDDYRINYYYEKDLDDLLSRLCEETKSNKLKELDSMLEKYNNNETKTGDKEVKNDGDKETKDNSGEEKKNSSDKEANNNSNDDVINYIKSLKYYCSICEKYYLCEENYTRDELFNKKLWLRELIEQKLGIELFQTDDEGIPVFPIHRIVTALPQKSDITYRFSKQTILNGELDNLFNDILKVYDDSQKNLIQVNVLQDALEKMNTDSVNDFSITNFPVLKYIYNTARYIIRTEMAAKIENDFTEEQETESDSSNNQKINKYKRYWKAKTEKQINDLATSTLVRIITIKRKSILKRLYSERTDDIISYLYRCIKNAVSDEYKIMFPKTEDICDLWNYNDEQTEKMDDCIDDDTSTKNDWYSRQPMAYEVLDQEGMKELCNMVLTKFPGDTAEVIRAKNVIKAFFIDGKQQGEIANELGLNISTIKKITCKEGLSNFGNMFGDAFRNEVNNNLWGFQVQSSQRYDDNSYADDLIDSTLQTPADMVRFAIMLGEKLGVMDDKDDVDSIGTPPESSDEAQKPHNRSRIIQRDFKGVIPQSLLDRMYKILDFEFTKDGEQISFKDIDVPVYLDDTCPDENKTIKITKGELKREIDELKGIADELKKNANVDVSDSDNFDIDKYCEYNESDMINWIEEQLELLININDYKEEKETDNSDSDDNCETTITLNMPTLGYYTRCGKSGGPEMVICVGKMVDEQLDNKVLSTLSHILFHAYYDSDHTKPYNYTDDLALIEKPLVEFGCFSMLKALLETDSSFTPVMKQYISDVKHNIGYAYYGTDYSLGYFLWMFEKSVSKPICNWIKQYREVRYGIDGNVVRHDYDLLFKALIYPIRTTLFKSYKRYFSSITIRSRFFYRLKS